MITKKQTPAHNTSTASHVERNVRSHINTLPKKLDRNSVLPVTAYSADTSVAQAFEKRKSVLKKMDLKLDLSRVSAAFETNVTKRLRLLFTSRTNLGAQTVSAEQQSASSRPKKETLAQIAKQKLGRVKRAPNILKEQFEKMNEKVSSSMMVNLVSAASLLHADSGTQTSRDDHSDEFLTSMSVHSYSESNETLNV